MLFFKLITSSFDNPVFSEINSTEKPAFNKFLASPCASAASAAQLPSALPSALPLAMPLVSPISTFSYALAMP
ncbi:hypothetical protein OTSGILL_2006 [Orientia tsutsugamushi str. Gilliam]|uniref:Uncharacterized protein n=1 Tax=Orientia tsutsugamushi str. Gilliam TaxID=1359184 RepID=A0A0F3M7W1_ORITS|nr:hypothetical protein [Orientia tsutsugamushi]KJV51825.1 hypothetical protein OTSGILL_2006 [Orientia tsutsugamushi str. Gilliam]